MTKAIECSFSEIAETLRVNGRILVFSHVNPDADAYGSSIALTLALRAAGVDAYCVNQDGPSERYDFIPGIESVLSAVPESAEPWDIVCICDCGDLNRVGDSFQDTIARARTVVNIDHHVSNPLYGTHTLVRDTASSTAELVYEVLENIPGSISSDVATCLYVGIVGDTGSFRYSSTSSRTFEIASRLLAAGVRADKISQAMFGSNTLSAVRLQSEAMSNLEVRNDGRVAEVLVTSEMYRKHGASREDADSLVERARDIKGICLSVLIKQDGDIWRVSLRSTNSRYNVSDIAASMGGGGHKMAAAFRWPGDLSDLRSALHSRFDRLFGG